MIQVLPLQVQHDSSASCPASFQAIFGLPLTETCVGVISTYMHDLPEAASM